MVIHSDQPAEMPLRLRRVSGIVEMRGKRRNVPVDQRGGRRILPRGKILRPVGKRTVLHSGRHVIHVIEGTEAVAVHVSRDDQTACGGVHSRDLPDLTQFDTGKELPDPLPVSFHAIPASLIDRLGVRRLEQLHVETGHIAFHREPMAESAPAGAPAGPSCRRVN